VSAIKVGWVRSLAGASACLAILPQLATASAASVSCCSDLEERVAELEATAARKGTRKVNLRITGAVSRAILFWTDGTEQNAYSVDNTKRPSAFYFDGEVDFAKGWRAGYTIGVEAKVAPSDTVDQFSDTGPGGFFLLSYSFFHVFNERLGTVKAGLDDSATDEIDNVNLAQVAVAADNAVQDWMASFFLRAGNGTVLNVRWFELFPPVMGTNGNLVTYISPEWMGFSTSGSWGQDDFRDVALRYSARFAQALEVKAEMGYYKNTTGQAGAALGPQEPVDDDGWGGSIAFKHTPTGLNIAVNYSTHSHSDRCLAPGAVSLNCRGDDELLYLVGGIVRNWIPLGPTAFYGEYYRGAKEWNESDVRKLRALERTQNQALELDDSTVTAWGFGLVQKIQDSGALVPAMELFLGYKHYEIDLELIGLNPTTRAPIEVPSKKLNDFDAVMTGAIVRF
jgi:hypothetical protein